MRYPQYGLRCQTHSNGLMRSATLGFFLGTLRAGRSVTHERCTVSNDFEHLPRLLLGLLQTLDHFCHGRRTLYLVYGS